VFTGLVHLYQIVLNIVGIWLIIALGFSAALVALIVILAVSFIFSLIVLAGQHG
jgi:hypothetical protein